MEKYCQENPQANPTKEPEPKISQKELRMRETFKKRVNKIIHENLEQNKDDRLYYLHGKNRRSDPYGWLDNFREATFFCIEEKRWPANSTQDPEEKRLGVWASIQRVYFRNNKLEEWKIAVLSDVCFEFEPYEIMWRKSFTAVKAFYDKHKRWPAKHSKDPEEAELGVWVSIQRADFKKGKLTKQRIVGLKSMDFDFDSHDTKWKTTLTAVQAFHDKHKRWPAKHSKDPEEAELGVWVSIQRASFKANKLTEWRLAVLRFINFDFNPRESNFINPKLNSGGSDSDLESDNSQNAKWRKNLTAFQAFYNEHKRCPSTHSKDPEEKRLGVWASIQRINFAKGKLAKWRLTILESIDFDFKAKKSPNLASDLQNARKWRKKFTAVQAFLNEHKRRPSTTAEDPEEKRLGFWVNKQRLDYRNNKLKEWRIAALKSINFDFETEIKAFALQNQKWEKKFTAAQAFYNEHKRWPAVHAKGPKENRLGRWISTQRLDYRNNKLEEEKMTILSDACFEFEPHDIAWRKSFIAMHIFHTKHKRWPVRTAEDPEEKRLGFWVNKQRLDYRNNKLKEWRMAALKSINFDFDPRNLNED